MPTPAVLPEVLGFDAVAEEYDRGRPDYPTDATRALTDALGIGPGRTALDLAAGTGKLTRALKGTGATLVAVEPLAGMRAVFQRAFPEVPLFDGTAEAIPLPADSLDAVVVGQAFHWFDASRALPEVRRVLHLHGGLGLIWNLRDDRVPWVAEVTALLDRLDPGVPRTLHERWKSAFVPGSGFAPLEHRAFAFAQHLDRRTLQDRFLSVSFVAIRPPEERARFANQVREIVDRTFGAAAEIELPYRTDVYWTRRVE